MTRDAADDRVLVCGFGMVTAIIRRYEAGIGRFGLQGSMDYVFDHSRILEDLPATIALVSVGAAPCLLALLMSWRAFSIGHWCTMCLGPAVSLHLSQQLAFKGSRFGCGSSVRAGLGCTSKKKSS